MTHICVGNLTIIGSHNGLSPGRRQGIIWTSAGILLSGPLGTSILEFLIQILTFSFKKKRLKLSSVTWRPFCLGLNVLTHRIRQWQVQDVDLTIDSQRHNIAHPHWWAIVCSVFPMNSHYTSHTLAYQTSFVFWRKIISYKEVRLYIIIQTICGTKSSLNIMLPMMWYSPILYS